MIRNMNIRGEHKGIWCGQQHKIFVGAWKKKGSLFLWDERKKIIMRTVRLHRKYNRFKSLQAEHLLGKLIWWKRLSEEQESLVRNRDQALKQRLFERIQKPAFLQTPEGGAMRFSKKTRKSQSHGFNPRTVDSSESCGTLNSIWGVENRHFSPQMHDRCNRRHYCPPNEVRGTNRYQSSTLAERDRNPYRALKT